ncbi:MAG: hypothetical protein KatS3mg129_0542 [Leptospiraceae bacterium]|nr:MAG: hypothetical protein KatS3mg129_0542 [Leptospiraceae bacterium]
MFNYELNLFKEIFKAILNEKNDKAEYLLHHYLENEPINGTILLSDYLSTIKKEHEKSKKLLYKLILKNKYNIDLRLQYIKILLNNKEYEKAIKWCQKSLHLAKKEEKTEIYYNLAKIFYYLNRPERSLRYANLCLQMDQNFFPAKQLKKIIIKNLNYEPY